ncbi:hypothetical protein NM688_g4637 [Phlebia brevispora]|uniref:Uncharacterized protein n=1 Tax=Phlebia brevispora TaxID=194682 RepID=A0ACC1T237_9APHY|nr:hypothetical protein NM688_g4637 [Phlebia brevispora]
MSSPLSEIPAAAVYSVDLVSKYTTAAALALVCYEFVITIGYEYESLWERNWTASTWLFVGNRYVLLAATIAEAILSCTQASNFTLCLPRVLANAKPSLVLLRFHSTCLLGNSSKSALYLCGRVHGLKDLRTAQSYLYHRVMCLSARTSPSSDYCVNLVAFSTMIASDILAIGTIWIKTYRQVKRAASVGLNVNFSRTLLEHGTLYFVIICAVNLAGFLFHIASPREGNPMVIFISTIPSIVLSRFLINLREVGSRGATDTAQFSSPSALNFRMTTLPGIIGNLGEPFTPSGPNSPDLNGSSSDDSTQGDHKAMQDVLYANSGNLEEVGMLSHRIPDRG